MEVNQGLEEAHFGKKKQNRQTKNLKNPTLLGLYF